MAPSPGVNSPRQQVLSEQQRQAIIAKLLAERRGRSAAGNDDSSGGRVSGAGASAAGALPDEERAARIQELIRQRLAAKQQQQQQGAATAADSGRQHAVHEQQHHHHHHQHHHRQHRHQQHRRSSTGGGGLLPQQSSRDVLLSPGSSCSLASSTTLGGGAMKGKQQHHQQQQQPAKRQSSISATLGSPPLPLPPAVSSQPEQQPQRQQQHGPPGPRSFLLHQQRQQQQMPDSVLDGPVDISDLWGGGCSAAPSASQVSGASSVSAAALTDDASFSTRHGGFSGGGAAAAGAGGGGSFCASELDVEEQLRLLLEASDGGDEDGMLSPLGGGSSGIMSVQGTPSPQQQAWGQQQRQQHGGRPGHRPQPAGGLSQQQDPQQRLAQLHALHKQLTQQRQQPQQAPQQRRGRQQSLPQQQQQPQQLPRSYPASREERLEQLAQPKAASMDKYEAMKMAAEQEVLQRCSFAPKTGRGPRHRMAPQGLPASDRLFMAAAEKAARLERKAAEAAGSDLQGCTFAPHTNAAANARHLDRYEYVPLHQRLAQVVRSRGDKLAVIQQQVESEQSAVATFAPRINPRSAALAALRRSRSCSRQRGRGDDGDGGQQEERHAEAHGSRGVRSSSSRRRAGSRSVSPASPGWHQQQQQHLGAGSSDQAARGRPDGGGSDEDGADVQQQQQARGRSRERALHTGLRRTWSEADLGGAGSSSRAHVSAEDAACTFTPRINAASQVLLQQSGEIPRGFLQRQEYFDRLAREKKQMLQLAVEDQHCSFGPNGARSSRQSWRGGGDRASSLDQGCDGEESYLDRIERLAYQDRRRYDAARAARAEHLHAAECSFRPAINPRSARMAKATPLEELHSNSKGRLRRESVALALEAAEEAECTFAPNLAKPGVYRDAPADAQLSLSTERVQAVVERLYSDHRAKEAAALEAASHREYVELQDCTFKPDIARTQQQRPRSQSPVLVRGLGRFLELKDLARQQAEAKAATEARVFHTHPRAPPAPFTVPQPFELGRRGPSVAEARRERAQEEAEAAAMAECTFAPRINPHKSRQQRVAEIINGGA